MVEKHYPNKHHKDRGICGAKTNSFTYEQSEVCMICRRILCELLSPAMDEVRNRFNPTEDQTQCDICVFFHRMTDMDFPCRLCSHNAKVINNDQIPIRQFHQFDKLMFSFMCPRCGFKNELRSDDCSEKTYTCECGKKFLITQSTQVQGIVMDLNK